MDGGAWWAAVSGVAQGWTRLKRLSSKNPSRIPVMHSRASECLPSWVPKPLLRYHCAREGFCLLAYLSQLKVTCRLCSSMWVCLLPFILSTNSCPQCFLHIHTWHRIRWCYQIRFKKFIIRSIILSPTFTHFSGSLSYLMF